MKRRAKALFCSIIACSAFAAFVLHFYPRFRSPHIPCILLHQIGPPTKPSDLWAVSRLEFTKILDELKKRSIRTLSLEEVRTAVEEGQMPQNPPYVYLTFDDGCRSHVDVVLPELLKRSFQATFFVTVPPKASTATLGRDEIKELMKAGTVQSHTKTFETLPQKTNEDSQSYKKRIQRDLVGFRMELSRLLGNEVYALAYPSGEHDSKVRQMSQQSGHRLCFTTEYGTIGPRHKADELPRFMITKDVATADVITFIDDDKFFHAMAALSCLLLALVSFIVSAITLIS